MKTHISDDIAKMTVFSKIKSKRSLCKLNVYIYAGRTKIFAMSIQVQYLQIHIFVYVIFAVERVSKLSMKNPPTHLFFLFFL